MSQALCPSKADPVAHREAVNAWLNRQYQKLAERRGELDRIYHRVNQTPERRTA